MLGNATEKVVSEPLPSDETYDAWDISELAAESRVF